MKADDTIVILPADKVNKTVVMNRRDNYDEKIETMLVDGTYKRLEKDPTAQLESKIDATLKQVEKRGEIYRERRG